MRTAHLPLLGLLLLAVWACGAESETDGPKSGEATAEEDSTPVSPLASNAEPQRPRGAVDAMEEASGPVLPTPAVPSDPAGSPEPAVSNAATPPVAAPVDASEPQASPTPATPVPASSEPAPDSSVDDDALPPPGNECTKETEAQDCPSLGCACGPGSYCDNGYCMMAPVVTPCGVDLGADPPPTPAELCEATGGTVITPECCPGAEPYGPQCGGSVPRECVCPEGPTESLEMCSCPEGFCFDRTYGCAPGPGGDMTPN
jgi:hypothetical protein